MTFYLWSKTPSDNDVADPTFSLREGWSPSIVNNSIRALMTAAAKFRDDRAGMLLSTGSGSAYAVATNQALSATPPDGFAVTWRAHVTNNANPTFSPDGQTARPLRTASGGGLPAGAIVANGIYQSVYIAASTEWVLHGFYDRSSTTIDIPLVLGDGTNVIPTGASGRFLGPFDFPFTLLGWSALGKESGSISVDIWKCTYAQYDAGATHPVAGDKISSSAPITYSSAVKAQNSTLTGWSKDVAVNDILAFNVASVTSAKQVLITLKAKKTG